MDLPKVAIVMVTYERTEYAVRTVQGIARNLLYPEHLLGWYIGDDGSALEHIGAITEEIPYQHTFIGQHSEKFRPGTNHCGQSWNMALRAALDWAHIVLWLEDDWDLQRPLSIEPYVRLLMEKPEVGMVRLGHLPVGSALTSIGHDGVHYLRYEKTTQYAYSGNPSLRHRRFVETYGFFAEDKNPGEVEVDLDDRVRANHGPEIWWPVDIGGWGVFAHIGAEKSFEG